MSPIKLVYLTLLFFYYNAARAHEPELSSAMIYDNKGKSLLVIRGSLSAFESEIDYNYGNDAYKTPEAFKELVIKHFQNNCFIIINADTIRLINPYIVLGHETNLFAELANTPGKVKSLYLKNTFFKDIPNNKSELILSTEGLPQQQYILNNTNKQEVKLKVKNGSWVIDEGDNAVLKSSNFILFYGEWFLWFL